MSDTFKVGDKVKFRTKTKTPRPKLNIRDEIRMADHMRTIPAYDGKPEVYPSTVLRVSSITGKGTKREPWGVSATNGTHFWHFNPADVERV